jgi:predicted PurR-regulated permease PerM
MHSENVRTTALVVLCTIAVVFVLYILKPLLIPFLIAVMISYLLSPVIEKMASWKVPRIVTLLVFFLVSFAVLGIFARMLATNISGFINELPLYQTKLNSMMEISSTTYPWLKTSISDITDFLFGLPLGSYANAIINSSLGFLSDGLLVVLFVTYLCLSVHLYPSKIQRAFDGSQGKKILAIMAHIHQGISQYISIHTFISLGVGITVGIICWAFGLPFAVLWGFLAFILNYIPTIGSIIALIPIIITAAVQLGFIAAGWILALIILSQIIWENIIESKLTGESLGLSPVVILLSLTFWGWLWGIVGAILAIPITYMIKIICENIPPLKAVAVFMDDK